MSSLVHDRMRNLRRAFRSVAFESLYRIGGRLYDPLTRVMFDGEWSRWRHVVVPLVMDGPTLDLGCGTGALLEALCERGQSAFGIDRSGSMLGAAKRRSLLDGRLIRGTAESLPIKDATLTACIATFPAPFILEQSVQREVARVLKPNGLFVVVLSGRMDLDSWRRRLTVPIMFGFSRGNPSGITGRLADLTEVPLPGQWSTLSTARGSARVWIATKLP